MRAPGPARRPHGRGQSMGCVQPLHPVTRATFTRTTPGRPRTAPHGPLRSVAPLPPGPGRRGRPRLHQPRAERRLRRAVPAPSRAALRPWRALTARWAPRRGSAARAGGRRPAGELGLFPSLSPAPGAGGVCPEEKEQGAGGTLALRDEEVVSFPPCVGQGALRCEGLTGHD